MATDPQFSRDNGKPGTDPGFPAGKLQVRPEGADLVIPALALAFSAYFFYSIHGLAWEAKANGVIIGTLLVALTTAQLVRNRLHHTLRVGDQLWASCWHAGMRVIDVADIRKPRTVGSYDYHPPFPEPTHTVLKVPFKVGGREIAVVMDEEHDHVPGRLHAGLWTFDVTDLANIKPIGMFHVSELDSPWSRVGRFGAHQRVERMTDTLVYATWFSGGLRIVDIADPAQPKEVGHFIPQPAAGQPSPQSNDVDLDQRGLIYLLDRNQGLDILEYAAHD